MNHDFTFAHKFNQIVYLLYNVYHRPANITLKYVHVSLTLDQYRIRLQNIAHAFGLARSYDVDILERDICTFIRYLPMLSLYCEEELAIDEPAFETIDPIDNWTDDVFAFSQ